MLYLLSFWLGTMFGIAIMALLSIGRTRKMIMLPEGKRLSKKDIVNRWNY